MATAIDLMDMTQPFQSYEQARKETPLFLDPVTKYWIVTKHADVRAILANDKCFSAEAERESYVGLSPEAVSVLNPIEFTRIYGLSTTENPDHDRVKRVALPLFNEQYFARLKPRLEGIADEFVDSLVGKTTVDLVRAVCNPFPTAAIFTVLGMPRSEVEKIKEWATSRLALTWGESAGQVRHAQNVVHLWGACRDLVGRKMIEPEDDLTSQLGVAIRDGALSRHDVDLLTYGLMFSGHATTSAFLAESVRLLLATETWDAMVEAGIPATPTADELLRLCPSAFTRRRLAREDVTIRGQRIPKGSTVLLVIGSANRDEEVFEKPDELRLDRKNANKHLSFGFGFHYCIGAKIVKLEYATLVDRLMRRFPRLSLAAGYEPKYNRNLSIRMPDSLIVSLGRETSL